MRKKLLMLFITCFTGTILFASERIEIKTPAEGCSTEAVVANIEATYDYNAPCSFEHFRDTVYVRAEKAVRKYLLQTCSGYDKNAIESYFSEKINKASQSDLGEEETIKYASIYLMCGWQTYADIAYMAMANAYANLNDKDNLRYVLHCFEHSDINKYGEYDAAIKEIRTTAADILHPADIAHSVQGVWVSDAFTTKKECRNFPYSIIDIRSMTDDGVYSLNLPSFTTLKRPFEENLFRDFRMAQKVEFDNPSADSPGRVSAIFSSQYLGDKHIFRI